MRRIWMGLGVAGAAAGAVYAGRRAIGRRSGTRREAGQDRWHSVTVNCEPEQLGPLPPPLDTIGLPIEVRITPAPGDRGSELSARLAKSLPTGAGKVVAAIRDDDPVRKIRKALREARQLVETGEILEPDSPSTTRTTLRNAPLAYVTRHGREEGRL